MGARFDIRPAPGFGTKPCLGMRDRLGLRLANVIGKGGIESLGEGGAKSVNAPDERLHFGQIYAKVQQSVKNRRYQPHNQYGPRVVQRVL